jgi:hypothetical protein
MTKTADAVRSARNQERVRNMKSMCLYCRNGEPVELRHELGSNIAYWAHGDRVCAASPIRNRAMEYESHHGPVR